MDAGEVVWEKEGEGVSGKTQVRLRTPVGVPGLSLVAEGPF